MLGFLSRDKELYVNIKQRSNMLGNNNNNLSNYTTTHQGIQLSSILQILMNR